MGRPLTVLLVEDEPSECQEMISYIESTSEVQLIGVTNNIIKALEHASELLPEAIILDLELHKGYGNGLTFLESLRGLRLSMPIFVLVTTNNVSLVTHDCVRKMGADFIMVKSQQDYSAKTVVDFLGSLKNIIHNNRSAAAQSGCSETAQQKQQRIIGKISAELDLIGIPPNAIGRKYIIEGITLIINGRSDKIYSSISSIYSKSEASVERAMQNAIGKAWRTANIDDLLKNYTARIHSIKGAPTIMEFIYYYAEKIKNTL